MYGSNDQIRYIRSTKPKRIVRLESRLKAYEDIIKGYVKELEKANRWEDVAKVERILNAQYYGESNA